MDGFLMNVRADRGKTIPDSAYSLGRFTPFASKVDFNRATFESIEIMGHALDEGRGKVISRIH